MSKDVDGAQTVSYINAVRKRIEGITTTAPQSLGLHPLVYFYTRGGAFQPIAFLAVLQVAKRLVDTGKLDAFTSVRKAFEDFLLAHKEAFTLIVKRQGAGTYQPHLHIVVSGEKHRALDRWAGLQPRTETVPHPKKRQVIADPSRQVSYFSWQSFWPSKYPEHGARRGRSRRHRLPPERHAEWLIWIDQFSVSDFVWMHGCRISDGKLVPS